MARREWTREELIVAFNLYCKTPFGKIHIRNPSIIELARAIGRTPSAVSWKLANFARLDPALQKRKIAGASHGAQAEVEVWEEFNDNWEQLAFESERLLEKITRSGHEVAEEMEQFPEGRTREAIVRTRVNQGFFRSAVLAAYGVRCCITGLSIPQLLNASHIVPWAVDIKNRTNPRNGLCLNVIHDRAFDCGLLTVAPDLTVKLSPKVKAKSADVAVTELLCRYEDVSITVPRRFPPDTEYLRFHNEKVFLRS
jgi:putative restriction endonuclease